MLRLNKYLIHEGTRQLQDTVSGTCCKTILITSNKDMKDMSAKLGNKTIVFDPFTQWWIFVLNFFTSQYTRL
jgi:hypothetical protein